MYSYVDLMVPLSDKKGMTKERELRGFPPGGNELSYMLFNKRI